MNIADITIKVDVKDMERLEKLTEEMKKLQRKQEEMLSRLLESSLGQRSPVGEDWKHGSRTTCINEVPLNDPNKAIDNEWPGPEWRVVAHHSEQCSPSYEMRTAYAGDDRSLMCTYVGQMCAREDVETVVIYLKGRLFRTIEVRQ